MGTKPQSPALAESLPPEKGSAAELACWNSELTAVRQREGGREQGLRSGPQGPCSSSFQGAAQRCPQRREQRAQITERQLMVKFTRKPDHLLLGNLIQKAEEKAAPLRKPDRSSPRGRKRDEDLASAQR